MRFRACDVEIKRGEYVAIMGPSGSGKSTLMNLIGCLDTPTNGRVLHQRNLVSDMTDDELARIRNKEIGFVFQTFNLLPRATSLHNVELPLIYCRHAVGQAHRDGQERHAAGGLWKRACTTSPTSFPAASGSAWRWPARWSTTLRFCWPTSPPATWIPPPATKSWRCSSACYQQGNTIVLVTHEHDIALHAHRVIHVRDGKVEKDEVVEH